MPIQLNDLINPILELAEKTGQAILTYFGRSDLQDVKHKGDESPVSAADLAAHLILVEGLQRLTPDIPILSEEGIIPLYEQRKDWHYYWLLDPLDGTRSFLQHSKEFAINIALIENHQPILGVVYAPAFNTHYYAARGLGAFKKKSLENAISIQCKTLNWNHFEVLTGYFHRSVRFESLLKMLPQVQIKKLNSAIKYGWVAEGGVDIYPRFAPTHEWDTAAGQCIVEEAGGLVVDLNGERLQYNDKISLLNPAFVALGDPKQLERILDLLRRLL